VWGKRHLALMPVVVLAGWTGAGSIEARTFADILGTPITRTVGDALATSIGRALPVTSASAGIVFRFDPTTGVFERETSILGQLFLERAEPVGRGRWNLTFNYQRFGIDTIEGEDIDALSDTNRAIVDPSTGNPVTFPLFGIDLDTDVFTASATYGITNDLDVNLTVPVVYSDFQLRVVQRSTGGTMSADVGSSKLGVGDIFLRGKYRFLRRDWLQAAGGLVLRVPSGNEENFQGTGDLELAPMLYVSTRTWQLAPAVRLQSYLNGGVNLDAEDVDRSEARWGVGLDVGFAERLTAAVAVLGRHPFQRIAPAGFFDVARVDGTTQPLFGLQGERPDLYDLSVGGRVNLWRDTLIGFANVILPLNDDGVRADFIPLVGLEATF
jgi:hypothetical protein